MSLQWRENAFSWRVRVRVRPILSSHSAELHAAKCFAPATFRRQSISMPDANGGPPDPPVRLSLPLEFQQEIFHELRQEDGLLVLARGLGLPRLVANLLHSYDAAGGNLILLVGAEDRENMWLGEALAEHATISVSPKCRGLQLVNTDLMSVGAREKMYAGGGIFSITSRILIVDFLSGLLRPETVTGMVCLLSLIHI